MTEPSEPVDPAEIQKRFDRLSSILGGIVSHADAQAATRCPYRDRHDRCTAKFRCRNQAELDRSQAELDRNQAEPAGTTVDEGPGDVPLAEGMPVLVCTHDGGFDYRSAWESDPRAADRARSRLARQRSRDPVADAEDAGDPESDPSR